MIPSQPEILVLYASQTGTAEYVAEEITRELIQRDFLVTCSSLDEYDITELPNQKYAIFVIATTGDGEPPTNMIKSWKFLLIKDLPQDSLSNLNFSIFGLGDSGYPKFNAMARKLYQRLLQLGASEFYTRGLGDDQSEFGYDSEFVPWLNGIFESLKKLFPDKLFREVDTTIAPIPRFLIDFLEESKVTSETERGFYEFKNKKYNNEVAHFAKITKNDRVTALDNLQDVRNIIFETENELKYDPGDVAVIQPRNDQKECDRLIEHLELKPLQKIQIKLNLKSSNKTFPFPSTPITISALFGYWLSILGIPSRYFFKILSYFTEDALHKEKLQTLGSNSNDGKLEYYEYCVKPRRTVYEILYDFPSVKIPLEYLLECVSVQRYREYSISTSNLVHKKAVGITMAKVEYLTKYKRKKIGICSGWLCEAPVGELVYFWIRKGTLAFPSDVTTPVICIGPGTGVAPIISFLEERVQRVNQGEGLGLYSANKTILFFGNRHEKKDFLHKEQLLEWNDTKKISLFTAFSRDQDFKIYVQHRMKENADLIYKLLVEEFENIKIFLCGSAKQLPKCIEDTFIEILEERIGGKKEAEEVISTLIRRNQFCLEVWS